MLFQLAEILVGNNRPVPGAAPPPNGYVTENGASNYVDEDGITYFVQET